MNKETIKRLIDNKVSKSGLVETGIPGVQLFNITEPVSCAPAVYEPSITAIVGGCKEAILDGNRHFYDTSAYICCPMSMPVEAGTPEASTDNPLIGVYIRFDTRAMTELAFELESTNGLIQKAKDAAYPQGISTANWDDAFTEALYRLILLSENPTDIAILGRSRLRELYYAILKGDAGGSVRRSFGVGNDIARSIEFLSSNLSAPVTIDNLADQIGMSRAVFHRKFKQATNMSPIQFVKSMRLNKAAMKIAEGRNVNVAAMEVGYVSSSQFSRDFRRMYGQSPKQWIQAQESNNA
ncbi:MAG: AraC family transcriptional regulator [Paraglaciecola chathamensis]